MDISYFMKIQNAYGTKDRREKELAKVNRQMSIHFEDTFDTEEVLVNGVPTKLMIIRDTGGNSYKKKIISKHEDKFNIGDYVKWNNQMWLITTIDPDEKTWNRGNIERCNLPIRWQNERGKIIERWAVIKSASKYNDGTTGNNMVMLGSDQLSVILPIDKESIRLKKSMGIKFFIDNNKENPTAYELTGTGNVPDTYDGHGVTSWIVKECAYTPSKLDLKYGVCDYKPHKHKKPLDAVDNLKCMIIGKEIMTNRYAREYKAIFTDDRENRLENVDFKWIVTSEFPVKQTVSENEIELYVDDPSNIGESFLLSVQCKNTTVASMRILITEGF